MAVRRPRARSAEGAEEVALETYAHFADRDPLTRTVLEQTLVGVSTRRCSRTRDPVGEDGAAERSVSKSSVSREFVGRTREQLQALMARRLDDVRLAAMMIECVRRSSRNVKRWQSGDMALR